MTEKEKMLAGEVYSATDPELLSELNEVKDAIHRYNALLPSQRSERLQMLKALLGHVGDDEVFINQPFYCDYGKHISVGRRFFANFNLTILDEARFTIGDGVTIGAGSVVVSEIPAGTVAVGNPCRVVKTIVQNEKTR